MSTWRRFELTETGIIGPTHAFRGCTYSSAVADDTDALQAAIDQYEKVFLPRGAYKIARPLVLHGNTKLFGGPGTRSRIYPRWDTAGQYVQAITTELAPDGDAYLGDVFIDVPGLQIGAIDWRVGRRSVVRQFSGDMSWEGLDDGSPRKVFQVEEYPSAGGSFFIAGGRQRQHLSPRVLRCGCLHRHHHAERVWQQYVRCRRDVRQLHGRLRRLFRRARRAPGVPFDVTNAIRYYVP